MDLQSHLRIQRPRVRPHGWQGDNAKHRAAQASTHDGKDAQEA